MAIIKKKRILTNEVTRDLFPPLIPMRPRIAKLAKMPKGRRPTPICAMASLVISRILIPSRATTRATYA